MNLTGATVDHVIDGDPEAVGLVGEGWSWAGVIAAETGWRCELVDPGSWSGLAANEFAANTAAHVATLSELAEALAQASALAREWGAVLDGARRRAADAIAEHERGLDQRAYWLANHEAIEVATGVPVADASVGTIAAAERMASAAQDELDAEARRIAARLSGVADGLVARYPWTSDVGHVAGEVGGAAVDATKDLLDMVTLLSPIRWLIDGDGARDKAKQTWDGVVATGRLGVSDPEALFSQLYDRVVNAAVANPARAAGRLAPDFALGAAGVAASSARAAQLLAWVDSLPAADRQAVLAFSAKWLVDLEALDANSHFVSRHGPQVTRDQLLERALYGILPDGGQEKPSAASRFYDWESMEAAVREGLAYHRLKGDTNFTIDFETAIGEGYRKLSTVLLTTQTVRFRFRSDGTLITAYPDVREVTK